MYIYIYIYENIHIYMLQYHKLCPMWDFRGTGFQRFSKSSQHEIMESLFYCHFTAQHMFFEQKLNIPFQTKIVNSFPVCYQLYLIWSQQRTHHPIETCWSTCTIRDQPTWLAGESSCSICSYISSNSRKATSSICSLSVLVSWSSTKIGSFFVLSRLDVATLVVFGSSNTSLSTPHTPPSKNNKTIKKPMTWVIRVLFWFLDLIFHPTEFPTFTSFFRMSGRIGWPMLAEGSRSLKRGGWQGFRAGLKECIGIGAISSPQKKTRWILHNIW